jgi:hypothetical protein
MLRSEPVLSPLDPGDTWHWFRYPHLHEGDTLKRRKRVRAALQANGCRIAQATLEALATVECNLAYATDPNASPAHGGTLLEQWMDARHLRYPPIAAKPYQALGAMCR